MMGKEPIKLKEQRDFGGVLNASFTFIAQEFKAFFKSLLFFAGPFLLLGALLIGMAQFNMMSVSFAKEYDTTSRTILTFVYYGIGGISMFIGFVVLLSTIGSYMKIYETHGKNNFEISDIWQETKSKIFIVGLAYVLMSVAYAIIAVFAIIFLEIPLIYVVISTIFITPILINEKIGIFQTVRRSFYLIKDRWFMTFGLIALTGLISYFISMALYVPLAILTAITASYTSMGDANIVMTLITVIYTGIVSVLYYFIYSLIFVIINIQYFNMVEQKDFPSLRGEVEKINAK